MVTVIAKCMAIIIRKLSAQRTMHSFLLSDGAITDVAMNRLSEQYDTTTQLSINRLVNNELHLGRRQLENTWRKA